MAKRIFDVDIDAMLALVEGDRLHANSAEPTTFTEATTTFNIATATISGSNYTKADGDVSGRKNTLDSPADISISTSGTVTHLSVTLQAGTLLKLVTTTNSQALTSPGTFNIPDFDHEIEDVT